jgi:hypothetical protein
MASPDVSSRSRCFLSERSYDVSSGLLPDLLSRVSPTVLCSRLLNTQHMHWQLLFFVPWWLVSRVFSQGTATEHVEKLVFFLWSTSISFWQSTPPISYPSTHPVPFRSSSVVKISTFSSVMVVFPGFSSPVRSSFSANDVFRGDSAFY